MKKTNLFNTTNVVDSAKGFDLSLLDELKDLNLIRIANPSTFNDDVVRLSRWYELNLKVVMFMSELTYDEKINLVRKYPLGIIHLLGSDEALIEEAFKANKDVVRFVNPNLMTYEMLYYYDKHYAE